MKRFLVLNNFSKLRTLLKRKKASVTPKGLMRHTSVDSLFESKSIATSYQKSLIYFTVHKCASAYVGNILWQLAERLEIIPVDIDGAISANACSIKETDYLSVFSNHRNSIELPQTDEEREAVRKFFLPEGYMYGPLRSATAAEVLPDLDRFSSILMLRDPRDVLTSFYFSIAYSHAKPKDESRKQKVLSERQRALDMTIDEYILSRADEWNIRYQRYLDSLVGKPGVTLLKYEHMVTDFPSWFDELINAWGIDVPDDVRNEFIDKADFSVDKEDVMSHKRQVIPGDHKRKLKDETIRELNEIFGFQLEVLGYDL